MKLHQARYLFVLGYLAAVTSQTAVAAAPPVVADAQVTLALGLGSPQGIAVSSQAITYVADTANNRVVTISSTGVVNPVSTPGFTLNGPGAVAVDAAGDLYIADTNNARVLKVPVSGNISVIAGSPSLSLPTAVTINASGDVYIGDGNKATVYEIPSGGAIKPLTIQGVGSLFPQALVTDVLGNLYIADGNSSNVYELPTGSTSAKNVNPSGFTLNSPTGLAFDAAGDFFVLDSGHARIIEVPQADTAHPYLVPITGLKAATSVALDPSGNLYITDSTNNNVVQLTYSGNPVSLGAVAIGSKGHSVALNYELNAPETLTAFHVVLQGDASSETAIVSGSTCKFQSYTVSPAGSKNPITATNPFQCLADIQGVPAFPGPRDGAINLLGSSNALLTATTFTETGAGPAAAIFPGVATIPVSSGLEVPQGIVISGENNTVYIADASAGEVYSWQGLNGSNSALTPVSTSPITLSQPTAVALDGAGNLYIADYTLAEIVVVPANTAIKPFALATGSVLNHPIALIVDAGGNLFIGDAGPDGIDATASQPGFIVKVPPLGAPITLVNTSPANVIYPQALATDGAGDLYVIDGGSDTASAQIVLVPQDGGTPATLDIPGLSNPSGIAVDPAGEVWVLDYSYLQQITIVPPNGGQLYTVPFNAPSLEVPTLMAFTAGARSLVISNTNDAFTSGELVEVSGTQSQLSFPQTAVGSQSAAQPAAIVNVGNNTVKPTKAGKLYSYSGNTQDFQIEGSSTCLSFAQLLPTQSCSFSASFAPVAAGTESESIASLFNVPAQVQLVLSGSTTASAAVAASPRELPRRTDTPTANRSTNHLPR